MAVDNIINRAAAGSLIPVEHSREIIKEVTQGSSFLRKARRLPNMTAKQRKMPVLAALAQAYFVGGDTGLKQTTKLEWGDLTIEAEEIAVIVPVPDAVLDDADYDIWSEVRPQLVEAIGVKIDRAAFYSEDKPSSWPVGVVPAAVAAGNAVTLGTNIDLYDDVLGENGMIAMVETDGYAVNGVIGSPNLKSKMRGARSANRPLFANAPGSESGTVSPYVIDGNVVDFPSNGGVDPTQSLLIAGDWTKLVYAIRQDITFEVFRQGVISDADGKVILNLMQQDASAIRAVFRMGWQRAKPINRVNPNASAHPFSVLLP